MNYLYMINDASICKVYLVKFIVLCQHHSIEDNTMNQTIHMIILWIKGFMYDLMFPWFMCDSMNISNDIHYQTYKWYIILL